MPRRIGVTLWLAATLWQFELELQIVPAHDQVSGLGGHTKGPLHLEPVNEFVPQDLSVALGEPLEVWLLLGELGREHRLVIGKRSEPPVDGDLVAVQLDAEDLDAPP